MSFQGFFKKIFGKKPKEKGYKELWSEHVELKYESQRLKNQIAQVEKKLLRIAHLDELFVGKTASFENGRKIRIKHTYKVLTGEKFDLTSFSEAYPHLCKVELNESEIGKIFQDADKSRALKSLGLDVEVKQYHTYE